MELIEPSVWVEAFDAEEMLKKIELAGRTCYKSEARITDDSAEKFIDSLIQRGHETVIEHEKVTARVICDRGVTHEIVRHRIASYSQESTRYCDYKNDSIKFIKPLWLDIENGVYEIQDWGNERMWSFNGKIFNGGQLKEDELIWIRSCIIDEHAYNTLRDNGWTPQQARSVLPNSLKTEIVMTMNLREWRHFFKLRCSKKSHPQMQQVANMLWDTMVAKGLFLIFQDVGPLKRV